MSRELPILRTNAASTIFLLLGLSATTSTAAPLQTRSTRASATTSYKIAIGFTIAICLLIFSAAVFYLGRRRERARTWFCWREPQHPTSEKLANRSDSSFDLPEPNRLKTRISCPKMLGSSAPVELSSPVDRKPKYLELSGEMPVYELGEPSPKRPRSSWYRRSMFFQSMDQEIQPHDPEKDSRDRPLPPPPPPSEAPRNEKYLPEVVPQTLNPPAYPGPTYVGRGRSTRRSSAMDWSGLEYVKRIYTSKSLRRPFQ